MEAGVPLACSDLPVMREVAGDYACYFYPYDIESIADGISIALAKGPQQAVMHQRFSAQDVKESFLLTMDGFMEGLQKNNKR